MQSSIESNIQGYPRSSTPLKTVEPKGKEPSKEAYEKKLMDLTEKMQNMERKHLAQIKEVQNRVITVEKTQPPPPPRTFPARQTWQRKNPNHEQRPPHQQEATNVVEPYKPFCRACKDFHEESGCHYTCYVQEHGYPEGCGPNTSASEPEFIHNVGDIYIDHKDSWNQANQFHQGFDYLTEYYGEMPSTRNNVQNFKGITYQRRPRERPSTQTASKVTISDIPPEIDDKLDFVALTFDLGSWLANSKVLVPVLELCKIPSQKEKLFKMLASS